MKIYVDAKAGRDGNGSKEMPFRRINDAAKVAVAGDEVLVAPGIYREYVNPINAGTAEARITYRSTEPLGAVITGAEAAVMVYNALDLAASQTMAAGQDTAPDWAQAALSSLAEAGMVLDPGSALTRGEAAQLLYSCARLDQQETLL